MIAGATLNKCSTVTTALPKRLWRTTRLGEGTLLMIKAALGFPMLPFCVVIVGEPLLSLRGWATKPRTLFGL